MKITDVAVSKRSAQGRTLISVSYVLLVDEWELGHWIEEVVVVARKPTGEAHADDSLVQWTNAPWALARADDSVADGIRLKRATPTQQLKLEQAVDGGAFALIASVEVKFVESTGSFVAHSQDTRI